MFDSTLGECLMDYELDERVALAVAKADFDDEQVFSFGDEPISVTVEGRL